MPYIPTERRKALFNDSIKDYNSTISSPGELNYFITTHLIDYLEANGTSYKVLNDLVGVLECVKLELYRRVAAPYEDKAIKKNGDVYGKKGYL